MAQASVPMPTPMSPAGNVTPPSSGGGPGNSCHRCGEEIKTAQFIRVGDYKFHKQHFTCVMCDKHLQGQKFNLKDGKFYCADDYILKFCHTCRHCKQKIPMGSVIQAFGGYYHPEHFVCVVCNEPFKNGKYYESDNQPYCETHFLALTAEKCDFCKKPVEEQNIARVQGKVFHNSCLFCHHCNAPLAKKGSIFQKDNQVYCKEDYLNFFCKRCTACGQHLVNSCITVNDEFYHPECLKCDVCSKKLDKYICMAGHLRCEEHTDFTTDKFDCSVCLKSIDGVPVLAAGKKCHEECFVCAFCADKLTKTASWLKQDQFCCGKCLMIKEEGRKRTQSTSNPASLSAPSNVVPAKRRNSESAPRSNGPEQKINSLDSLSENGGTGSGKGPRGSVTPKEKKIEWKKGELIGKGSFGKVYMGMNAATGELIAVKQVRLKTTEEQDQAKEIENEIKLMQDLRHPNIVSLLGTQRTGTTLNILMEYVPGKSLDTLLEKFGAFSEKVIKSYTKQLLAALAYCHSNHVVHRDIKGKNILIDTKGNLKLADFGSAKRFANVLSKDAPSVSYNYTPLWTAPEVLVGDYNSKVDIWSLGCVIIEMASGKPPWSEQNFENPFRALYHIGNSNSIPKIPDTLSDQGKQFILACLQRDPDKRPSAKECLIHAWLKDADDDADDSTNSNEADDD